MSKFTKQLEKLLKLYKSEFEYDEDAGTWCIFGTANGNGWETDDYEAGSLEQAESEAIEYIIANNN